MEDIDIIKRAVETGKTLIGSRSVRKSLSSGKPKLVIVSSNCPKNAAGAIANSAKAAKVPVYPFGGTSLELGEVCGRPFPISAMAVISPGDANLAQLAKGARV